MESLNFKYENFKKCYKAWGRCIHSQFELEALHPDNTSMQNLFNLINAGVIKHFELTYEIGWRFLKEYLLIIYDKEALSPKIVFRTCQDVGLFPEIIVNELITLANARNETTQIYNRILAQEVCNSIEKHYKVFGKVLEMIKL